MIYLPKEYLTLLMKANGIKFTYSEHSMDSYDLNYIHVHTGGAVVKIRCITYEETASTDLFGIYDKHLIILGRQKFIREVKKKQTQTFKNNVRNDEDDNLDDFDTLLSRCVENIFDLQKFYNVNVFYVETGEDLSETLYGIEEGIKQNNMSNRTIDSGISMINQADLKDSHLFSSQVNNDTKQNKPTTPKRTSSKKCANDSMELLKLFLSDIPSVSQDTALKIAVIFRTLGNIVRQAKSNKTETIRTISGIKMRDTVCIGEKRAIGIVDYISRT